MKKRVGKIFFLWGLLVATSMADEGFAPIFDGESLKNWREAPKGATSAWTVKDGVIRGEGKEDRLAYLVYSGDEALEDFELRFKDK